MSNKAANFDSTVSISSLRFISRVQIRSKSPPKRWDIHPPSTGNTLPHRDGTAPTCMRKHSRTPPTRSWNPGQVSWSPTPIRCRSVSLAIPRFRKTAHPNSPISPWPPPWFAPSSAPWASSGETRYRSSPPSSSWSVLSLPKSIRPRRISGIRRCKCGTRSPCSSPRPARAGGPDPKRNSWSSGCLVSQSGRCDRPWWDRRRPTSPPFRHRALRIRTAVGHTGGRAPRDDGTLDRRGKGTFGHRGLTWTC